jgi:hypothetical protein
VIGGGPRKCVERGKNQVVRDILSLPRALAVVADHADGRRHRTPQRRVEWGDSERGWRRGCARQRRGLIRQARRRIAWTTVASCISSVSSPRSQVRFAPLALSGENRQMFLHVWSLRRLVDFGLG